MKNRKASESVQVNKPTEKNRGGRPTIDDALKQVKGFPLRLKAEEWNAIEKAYKERLCIEKLSRNSFIIECALSATKNKKGFRTKSTVQYSSDKKELGLVINRITAIRNELKRISNNLNQLVKQTYFLNLTPVAKKGLRENIEKILPEIDTLIQENIVTYQRLMEDAKIDLQPDNNNLTETRPW